jgi:hypothetical protein
VSLFKAAAPVFVVLVVLLVQAELPPNVGVPALSTTKGM